MSRLLIASWTLALAFTSPAAATPAETFVEEIMRCRQDFRPASVIRLLQDEGYIGRKPVFMGDGIPTFPVIKTMKLFGLDVRFVEGWDHEGGFFKRGPGTAPPIHIGIVFDRSVDPDKALPAGLVKPTSGGMEPQFLYTSTSNYFDRNPKPWPALICTTSR